MADAWRKKQRAPKFGEKNPYLRYERAPRFKRAAAQQAASESEVQRQVPPDDMPEELVDTTPTMNASMTIDPPMMSAKVETHVVIQWDSTKFAADAMDPTAFTTFNEEDLFHGQFTASKAIELAENFMKDTNVVTRQVIVSSGLHFKASEWPNYGIQMGASYDDDEEEMESPDKVFYNTVADIVINSPPRRLVLMFTKNPESDEGKELLTLLRRATEKGWAIFILGWCDKMGNVRPFSSINGIVVKDLKKM